MTEPQMTLAEWRAECPWLDKPDHEPTACFHCATDEELAAAMDGTAAGPGTTGDLPSRHDTGAF